MPPRRYTCKASFPEQKTVGANRRMYILRKPPHLLGQVYLDWETVGKLGPSARSPGYDTAPALINRQRIWCEETHGGHDEPPPPPLIEFTEPFFLAFMAHIDSKNQYQGPPLTVLAESVGALSHDPRAVVPASIATQPIAPSLPLHTVSAPVVNTYPARAPTQAYGPDPIRPRTYASRASTSYSTPPSSFASSQPGPSSSARIAPRAPSLTATEQRARRFWDIHDAILEQRGASIDDDSDSSDTGTVVTLDDNSASWIVTAPGIAPTIHGTLKGAHRQKKALHREGHRHGVLLHHARNAEERDSIFERASGP